MGLKTYSTHSRNMDSAPGQRPQEWYMSWMTGPAKHQIENRKEACGEVIAALTSSKDTSFDVDTLRDLLAILNHEFLCIKLGSSLECDDFPVVFSRALGDRLLNVLSDCLVKSTAPTAYLERELQCRALLTTIALLHAQGAPAFHNGFYEHFYTSLQKRFEDLHWQAGNSGDLTYAKFFKVQCSYLLSVAKELSTHFQKAEPLALPASSKIISILSFASSPSASVGAFDLHAALRQLTEALKDVSHRAEKRHQALFSILELTTLTQSLQLYSKIAKQSYYDTDSDAAAEAAKRATRFASLTLQNIYTILIEQDRCERDKYESRVHPPAEFWHRHVLTTLHRGPPSFNLYYYLYGIVDCAAQVSKIVEHDVLPPQLGVRLRQVALLGDEATHRWKALEYLVSAEANPLNLEKILLRDAPKAIRTRFHNELTYINTLVSGAIATYPLPSQLSGSEEKARKKIISPAGCVEADVPVTNITPFCHNLAIKSHELVSKPILSTGLAPDCNAAFVLTRESAFVFSLINSDESGASDLLASQDHEDLDLRQACVSDRYLATITKQDLTVTAYSHDTSDTNGDLVGTVRLGKTSDGHHWVPRFLDMKDSPKRTWIAVAGETTVKGVSCGIVEIYELYHGVPKDVLRRHDNSFTLASREVLKGDQIKSLSFSPGGGRLACVTNSNRAMVWLLSNNLRPRSEPFVIRHKTTTEPDVRGLTSATVFQTPSSKFYMLGTAWPSSERHKNGGEWCFLTPIASAPADVPKKVFHKLQDLGDAGPFIAGAASPNGDMIALWERSGHIYIVPLMKNDDGGLRGRDVIKLGQHKSSLIRQNETNPSAMRFRMTARGLELFVIKGNGVVVQKHFEEILGNNANHSPRLSELAGLEDDTASMRMRTPDILLSPTNGAELTSIISATSDKSGKIRPDGASMVRVDSGVGDVSDDGVEDAKSLTKVTRCEIIGKASTRSIVDKFPRGSPCDKSSTPMTLSRNDSACKDGGGSSSDLTASNSNKSLGKSFFDHLASFEELEEQMIEYTSFLNHVHRDDSTLAWSTFSPKTPSIDGYMSSIQEIHTWVSHLELTNQSVLYGFQLLQQMSVIEEYMSIIVMDNKRAGVARVLPIHLTYIEAMKTAIQESLDVLNPHIDDPRELDWGVMFDALSPLKRMWDRMSAAFELILPGSRPTDDDLPRAHELEGLQVLNEMILVGLISYTRSHTEPFLQNYLGKTCKELDLKTSAWSLKFCQMPIRCLESLVEGPLWVFKMTKNSDNQPPVTNNEVFLSTTILDFADLWGPARLVLEDNGDEKTREIDWPGGTLRAQLGIYANQPRTINEEVRCYCTPWTKVGTREDFGPIKAFDCTKTLLIS